MNIARRHFLNLAAGAVAMPAVSRLAHADTYPSRAVHVIVPQAAASSTDIHARLIGQFLQDHLGQAFVVDVKPGAGGNVGTEFVVHATPDGYTLLTVNSQNAISPSLYPDLTFNFLRDIVPIGQISLAPMIMEVNPSVPANTVPEFIAYAKANPGKISMASAGVGGPQHLAGELFKSMTGLNLVHVPYRGSTPAVTDMLAGQVQLMFDVTPTALPQVKAGKLRAARRDHEVAHSMRCPMCHRCPISCPATRPKAGSAWARPPARRPRSSKRSTNRSTRRSPTTRSSNGLPISASSYTAARPRISANSSPAKPRNGAR